ncbi:MAG: GNAT family N-acetyltransferase [Candidatus Eisenbacteria bacterium]
MSEMPSGPGALPVAAIGALSFRRARAIDAEALARVAWAAKAGRGYPFDWLMLWKDDLEPSPTSIEAEWYFVAETSTDIIGFVAVEPLGTDRWELTHLWVRPEWQGRGVGDALFAHAASFCVGRGTRTLVIVSDPGAEPFYAARGAVRVGVQASRPEGRELPVLELELVPRGPVESSFARTIQPLAEEDRPWAREFLQREAGSLRMVSRGVLHQVDELQGLVGRRGDRPVALATYAIGERGLEVVTLHSAEPSRGFGTLLLAGAQSIAIREGCRRVWLITTNDNMPAIRFYRRRGFSLVAVHVNAVVASRRLKPEIPELGVGGLPIRDEIEFERLL